MVFILQFPSFTLRAAPGEAEPSGACSRHTHQTLEGEVPMGCWQGVTGSTNKVI